MAFADNGQILMTAACMALPPSGQREEWLEDTQTSFSASRERLLKVRLELQRRMGMRYNNPHLCHVTVEPPSPLAPWSQQLVSRKYALDAWLSKAGESDDIREFVTCFPRGWAPTWTTISPWTFTRAVLPFFDVAEKENRGNGKERGVLWVEPSVIVGESGRWRASGLNDEERKRALECCERQVAQFLETGEWSSRVGGTRVTDPHPRCLHVEPLGLYLANEGKNRVALYQKLGLPMPTDVWSSGYIAPQRMALIQGGDGWAVQLDEGETRAVSYCADIIVPMLAAYGVGTARPRQPEVSESSMFRRVLHRLVKR